MRHHLWALPVLLSLASLPALAIDPQAQAAVNKAEVLEQKVAGPDKADVPQGATPKISKAEVQAVDPTGSAPVDDTVTCLARTIYWEAKGGTDADMAAVASVVLNRVGHEGFPATVCGVVKQGAQSHHCQFSWWCDGRSDAVQEEDRYNAAREIARKALNRQLPDLTHGAMYFHDRRVSPSWARQYIRTASTDRFLLYKPRGGDAR